MTADLLDYHAAREAQMLRLEDYAHTTDRTKGDTAGFYVEPGAAGKGEQPVTYKRWLQQTRRPAPSPDEIATVDAAHRGQQLAAAWAAHDSADAASDQYTRATVRRGEVFADLIADGWTFGDLARELGVSRSAVHQAVAAHHRRTSKGE